MYVYKIFVVSTSTIIIINSTNKNERCCKLLWDIYHHKLFPPTLKLKEWSYSTEINQAFNLGIQKNHYYNLDDLIEHNSNRSIELHVNYKWHRNVQSSLNFIYKNNEVERRSESEILIDQIIIDHERLYQEYKSLHTSSSSSSYDWYNYFGYHYDRQSWTLTFREWVPNIQELYLLGDFNNWEQCNKYKFRRESADIFELVIENIPIEELYTKWYRAAYKLGLYPQQENNHPETAASPLYRMSPWTKLYVQDPVTHDSKSVLYFKFFDKPSFTLPGPPPPPPPLEDAIMPLIYEIHIGCAKQTCLLKVPEYAHDRRRMCVGTIQDLVDRELLQYVKNIGYNTVQFMGILEHPLYNSFGYQPNFVYAPSSRYGTPNDLRQLIKLAHSVGLRVILDIIQGHSVQNINDGLHQFNGKWHDSFFIGPEIFHPEWKCKMFNLGNTMVVGYLLSNIMYWIHEYGFDGFRFDAVTSIIYRDFGHNRNPGDLRHEFLTYPIHPNINIHGICYLRLVHELLRRVSAGRGKQIITIAEEVSFAPGLCCDTFIGFGYRLGMNLADMLEGALPLKFGTTKTTTLGVSSISDVVNFDVPKLRREIFSTYNQNLYTINYFESHDQVFVGKRSVSEAVITSLSGNNPRTATNPRYISLNLFLQNPLPSLFYGVLVSMFVKLLIYSTSVGGYMTFMGSEFNHPGWIEFPTAANNDSYIHCSRRWDLIHDQIDDDDNDHTDKEDDDDDEDEYDDRSKTIYNMLLSYEISLKNIFNEFLLFQFRPVLIPNNYENSIVSYSRRGFIFVLNCSASATISMITLIDKSRKEIRSNCAYLVVFNNYNFHIFCNTYIKVQTPHTYKSYNTVQILEPIKSEENVAEGTNTITIRKLAPLACIILKPKTQMYEKRGRA